MNEDYVILVDENGTPYIAHGRFHKYIQKIGDRYFYTMKELQAYLNRKKADFYEKAHRKVEKAANKAYGRAGYYEHENIWSKNNKNANFIRAELNKKLGKALDFVSDKLDRAAANAAFKVIAINRDVTKRQVDRFIENKIGLSDDTRSSIMNWLFKH